MENKIRQLREVKGITQAELSRRLGVSGAHMNRLEKSKKQPSVSMALRIAKVLDCTLNDIFSE